MAKRKKIDSKALLKMVKDGVEQPEIMNVLGIKTAAQLKVAYANALIETGEAPEIKGLKRRRKQKPVNMQISVNARGSLILSKKMINSMGIKPGQAFDVKKTASGIQLKFVAAEPAA